MAHRTQRVGTGLRVVRAALLVVLAAAAPAGLARAEETHDLQRPAQLRVQVGKPGTLSIAVQGKNGWHVNDEAPITLKLSIPDGVAVDKDRLARADLAESSAERARFDVQVTPSRAGEATVTAEARFVMCQASACKPVKESLTLAIVASDAPPAPARAAPAPARRK